MKKRWSLAAGTFALLVAARLPASGQVEVRQVAAPGPSAYVYTSDGEMDRLVSPVALYPDPLLAQVMGAATFPLQIAEAAQWSDLHHYLSGEGLARAMRQDHLPWDPAVQALLPFPSVLERLAGHMGETAQLGGAFLAQREDLMNSIQRMRLAAKSYGYLQTNAAVFVSMGPYIQILPKDDGFVAVPQYDAAAVFLPAKQGTTPRTMVSYHYGETLGTAFHAWGWGVSRFLWAEHEMYTHRPASQWEPESRQEGHGLVPRTKTERDGEAEGFAKQEVHGQPAD